MARRGEPKTGGRKAGTPNRSTKELHDRLAKAMGKGWCAVTAMAEMALEPDLKPEIKARLLAEVASYQTPKPKPRADVEEEMNLAEALQAARKRAGIAEFAVRPVRLEELVTGSMEPVEIGVITGVHGGLVSGDEAIEEEHPAEPAAPPPPPPRLDMTGAVEAVEPPPRRSRRDDGPDRYADAGDHYNPLDK